MDDNELKIMVNNLVNLMRLNKRTDSDNTVIAEYVHTKSSRELFDLYKKKLSQEDLDIFIFYYKRLINHKLDKIESRLRLESNVKQFKNTALGQRASEGLEIFGEVFVPFIILGLIIAMISSCTS